MSNKKQKKTRFSRNEGYRSPPAPPRKTGAILEGRKFFEKGPEKMISSGKSFIFSTFLSGNDRNSPPEADTPAGRIE